MHPLKFKHLRPVASTEATRLGLHCYGWHGDITAPLAGFDPWPGMLATTDGHVALCTRVNAAPEGRALGFKLDRSLDGAPITVDAIRGAVAAFPDVDALGVPIEPPNIAAVLSRPDASGVLSYTQLCTIADVAKMRGPAGFMLVLADGTLALWRELDRGVLVANLGPVDGLPPVSAPISFDVRHVARVIRPLVAGRPGAALGFHRGGALSAAFLAPARHVLSSGALIEHARDRFAVVMPTRHAQGENWARILRDVNAIAPREG